MANELDTSFSIQDTMEMGMGNQELLNDLFSPETSTSNPEDVTAIIKDADAPSAPAAPARLGHAPHTGWHSTARCQSCT